MRRGIAALALVLAVAVLAGARAARAQEELRPVAVVLLGGYGADLDEATAQFAELRGAIAARVPGAVLVQYSFLGTGFDGCTAVPASYMRADTAQPIELSKRVLAETLAALDEACPTERVVLVGHSLGGLIAFDLVADGPVPRVTDLFMVDSPLGGVPDRLVRVCIDTGFCAEGAVAEHLVALNARALRLEADNAARAAALAATGVQVSAWGNDQDCFYNLALCSPFTRLLVGSVDARETQWLGIPNTVRKSFSMPRGLDSIGPSHTAVLRQAAGELAAAIAP